jgi:hypothetical protein
MDALVQAKLAEIKLRYRRNARRTSKPSIAAVRIKDLRTIFADRYGDTLPDDDAGREDARVMLHHMAFRPNAEKIMRAWLGQACAWMPPSETSETISEVFGRQVRWKADTLAEKLNLTDADRTRLRITTIGAIGVSAVERKARRRERQRLGDEARRRAKGAVSRAEYLASVKR